MTPRPTRFDPDVISAAVDELWPLILEWHSDVADNEKGAKADLRDALDGYEVDGYHLARHLDKAGWGEVDSALVDVLDQGAAFVRRAHREAIVAWVQREGITPAFDSGAKVRSDRMKDGGVGVIAKIDATHAEYVVRFPSLGHVGSGNGTYGTYLNFEDVEAAK